MLIKESREIKGITHHPICYNIQSIQSRNFLSEIRQHKRILHRNDDLHKIFKDKIFPKSKRQISNLKRLLIKANFTCKQPEEFNVKNCNEPRCGLCKHLMEGSSVSFRDKTFKVNDNLTCKAEKVIYVIQCRGCNEQYIGETVNLRNRVTLHNQHIRVPELWKIPVSGHIADCSDREPNYFMFPFYQMKTEIITKRKEKEKFFIRMFIPKLNSLQWIRCIVCTDRKEVDNVTLRYLPWQQNVVILQWMLYLNKALKIV